MKKMHLDTSVILAEPRDFRPVVVAVGVAGAHSYVGDECDLAELDCVHR